MAPAWGDDLYSWGGGPLQPDVIIGCRDDDSVYTDSVEDQKCHPFQHECEGRSLTVSVAGAVMSNPMPLHLIPFVETRFLPQQTMVRGPNVSLANNLKQVATASIQRLEYRSKLALIYPAWTSRHLSYSFYMSRLPLLHRHNRKPNSDPSYVRLPPPFAVPAKTDRR